MFEQGNMATCYNDEEDVQYEKNKYTETSEMSHLPFCVSWPTKCSTNYEITLKRKNCIIVTSYLNINQNKTNPYQILFSLVFLEKVNGSTVTTEAENVGEMPKFRNIKVQAYIPHSPFSPWCPSHRRQSGHAGRRSFLHPQQQIYDPGIRSPRNTPPWASRLTKTVERLCIACILDISKVIPSHHTSYFTGHTDISNLYVTLSVNVLLSLFSHHTHHIS